MKFDDEMMKKLLRNELEQEAEEIRCKIEQDTNLDHIKPDPDLKNKILKKAEELEAQRELYDNLPELDKEALRLGRELQLRREEKEIHEFADELVPEHMEKQNIAAGGEDCILQPDNLSAQGKTRTVKVKKRKKKAIIALAVAVVAVLGGGMISFGDRGFITQTVNQILGGRKTTNIDTNRKEKDINTEIEEEKVFQQIKDKFGFDAVRMDYKPKIMKVMDFSIDNTLLTANLYYQYENNILTYTIMPVYRDASAGYDIEDSITDEYTKVVNNIKINITEYLISDMNKTEYSAKFKYQDVEYFLTGIIEKEEFEKILENLHFF